MDDHHKPDLQSSDKDERKDEDVIDLTQVVEEAEDDIIELDALVDEPEQTAASGDDDVIDLLEAVEPMPAVQEDATTAENPAGPVDTSSTMPPNVSEAQLDAALERVIEKLYAKKIERLMLNSIEKTVKREIEKIKKEMLEDSDDMSA